jgi:dipeptidyl aminopeptidase/acylaminoacyl peptidase
MKPIAIDHFCNYLFPSSLKSNENGRIAFIGKRASLEDNKYLSDLYLLENGKPVKLTASGGIQAFYWLGDSLVFPDIRKEKDKAYTEKKLPLSVLQRLSPGPGEAQEFVRFAMTLTDMAFVSENEFFFTAVYDPRIERLPADDEEKAAKTLKEENEYIVFDEIPFWRNGEGVTNKKRNRLYHYSGGTTEAVTDPFTDVLKFRLIPDSGRVIFISTRFTDKMDTSNELFLHEKDGSLKNISFEPSGFDHQNFISAGADTIVLQGTDRKEYGLNQNGDFFLYNYVTGEKTVIDDSHNHNGYNSVGSDVKMGGGQGPEWQIDKTGIVYFTETIDDSSHIMSIDPGTRKLSRITAENGLVQEFILSGGPDTNEGSGDSFIAIAMRGNDGPELYRIEKNGRETRLTTMNAGAIEGYAVSTPESFTFRNEAGDEIRGWIIKPSGFDPAAQYPVILDIHGGPKTVYGSVFFHEMQYWASCGYAVIFCNPTGSDGKGAKFADIRGKYGTVDYNDIMTFVDKCLERNPWMDADRLGVTGGSYGGFMTNWVIGHTQRFKAAAAQRSISNWLSLSNTTDIGYYFSQDQIGEDLWSGTDKLWWHSPLKYADRVRTPTLFIHSDEDYRCWMAEGLQMFSSLKYHGVDARMCLFRGENHELSRSGLPKHRIRRLDEITKWFDKYLKCT